MKLARKLHAEPIRSDVSKSNLLQNERLVDWCNLAVIETFSTVLGVAPKMKSTIKDISEFKTYEVSGVIGFIQNGLEGTLALGFSQSTLSQLLTKFYGHEVNTIDSELIGGVSELTNIVFGMIKEKCNESGFNFQMCLPIVIVGPNHSMFSGAADQKLTIEYKIKDETFWLEISTLSRGN